MMHRIVNQMSLLLQVIKGSMILFSLKQNSRRCITFFCMSKSNLMLSSVTIGGDFPLSASEIVPIMSCNFNKVIVISMRFKGHPVHPHLKTREKRKRKEIPLYPDKWETWDSAT